MKIMMVIPAYNAATPIAQVIAAMSSVVPLENIIVVDDGSTDTTATIARQTGAVVLSHVCNRGQGAALATGTTYALRQGADIIVHCDADGQHQVHDLPTLLEPILKGTADMVLGSRFLNTANRSFLPWSKRYMILPLARWINNLLTGLSLTDGHNGWRVMSRAVAEKLHITQDRMAHNTEITAQIATHHLRYTEIPVQIVYHRYGQSIRGGIHILMDLFKKKIL